MSIQLTHRPQTTGPLTPAAEPTRTLNEKPNDRPLDKPQAADIRISIISDHEWRICDRRIPETNAESVLGYIEKTGEFFEVMRLTATRNLLYYADFENAIKSFSSTVAPSAVGRVS
ncbi:MAG: hypothetical protein JWQ64_2649 [Subtercola sp.]|nr:hypothetical protein [Subtercola sp.]